MIDRGRGWLECPDCGIWSYRKHIHHNPRCPRAGKADGASWPVGLSVPKSERLIRVRDIVWNLLREPKRWRGKEQKVAEQINGLYCEADLLLETIKVLWKVIDSLKERVKLWKNRAEWPHVNLPWEAGQFEGWSIVGMNHYSFQGSRHLYVAMMKDGKCVKAEGPNDLEVFHELARKIREREMTPTVHK